MSAPQPQSPTSNDSLNLDVPGSEPSLSYGADPVGDPVFSRSLERRRVPSTLLAAAEAASLRVELVDDAEDEPWSSAVCTSTIIPSCTMAKATSG